MPQEDLPPQDRIYAHGRFYSLAEYDNEMEHVDLLTQES